MQQALPRFRQVLHSAVTAHQGQVIQFANDTLQAVFHSAPDAIQAALQAQQELLSIHWDLPLQPRLALLTGTVQQQGDEFLGPAPHRAARLLSVAHGNQVLVCHTSAGLAQDHFPPGASLLDLGPHHLPDLTQPERIFQLLAPGLPSDFPPLLSLDNRPTNLPVQPNSLVGRQVELLELSRLLRSPEVRLMTLTGIGGAGKTRLALQAGADRLADFADGVFFVPLDQLSDPSLIVTTIASALSLELSGSQPVEDLLVSHLRSRQVLLILDNFEHLLVGAPAVSRLLSACPQLIILATSREALRLRGEREFPLSPLPLPDLAHPQPPEQLAQFASVALFLQRAQAVRPNFQVTSANAPAIAEICTTLDGLPLALELAAARLRMFTPQALLARLKAQPGLQLLSGGPRDLPARQQTLQNAIQWSYDLLSPPEQALFRRLGVFAGGFSLEAAEAVCSLPGEPADQSFDLLTSLVEKSLVRFSEIRSGEDRPDDSYSSDRSGGDIDSAGQPRYSLLFLLRQFALDKIQQAGELTACSQQHATFFLSLAQQAKPGLEGGDPLKWVRILELEHDNLRIALNWSLASQSSETAYQLVSAIWRFWVIRGYLSEGRLWAEKVHALSGKDQVPTMLVANLLNIIATLARFQGDFHTSRQYYEESLEIYRSSGDRLAMAKTTGNLGNLLIAQGDNQSGSRLLEDSIVILREYGDKSALANSLNALAFIAMDEANYPRAKELLAEALSNRQEMGDRRGVAISYSNLGLVELYQNQYEAAEQTLQESLKIFQESGDQLAGMTVLANLGLVQSLQGNLVAARSNIEKALKAHLEIGNQQGIAETLEGLAGVTNGEGNPEPAAILLGAAEALREAIEAPLYPADLAVYQKVVSQVQSKMKKSDLSIAWSKGRQMFAENLEAVVSFALETGKLLQPSASQPAAPGLTTRETEILRLVARGLTDAQVAEELFISPRTVNAHLTSIYNKLGVNSRAAATRYAIENGLG